MSQRPKWAQEDVDLDRPNAARVYDYYLGGGCNFAADRAFAKQVIDLVPEVRVAAQLNRAFLRRAVQHALDSGIRQFLDLGSGIPTVGNVHEIAKNTDENSRVVYVDNEAVAVAHATEMLREVDGVTVLNRDLRDVDSVLGEVREHRLLDFSEPVALLMVSVLHFVPDGDEPETLTSLVRRYVDVLAPGSFLIISHATPDSDPERLGRAAELYRNSTTPFIWRTVDKIAEFFHGTELIEPGLVFTPQWRPAHPEDIGDNPENSDYRAGVGVVSEIKN